MLNIIDILKQDLKTGETIFCLQVSTRDDLPSIGAQLQDGTVGAGTIAQVVQEDAFVTLDADGDYYPAAPES